MKALLKDNYHEFNKKFAENVVLFLTRDNNFTLEAAQFEFKIITDRIGYVTFINNPNTYLKVDRIGSRKILNRKQRIPVLESLKNAFNHTVFAVEQSAKAA